VLYSGFGLDRLHCIQYISTQLHIFSDNIQYITIPNIYMVVRNDTLFYFCDLYEI